MKIAELQHDADRRYAIRLVPPKDETLTIHAEDSIVVLAENES